MYGTRKEMTRALNEMFTADEPLALLVWTTESVVAMAESHGITETEACDVLALVGDLPMSEHQRNGVSYQTIMEALTLIRVEKRPVNVPADLLARLIEFAGMALDVERGIAQDDQAPLPHEVVQGLDTLTKVKNLLDA